LAVSTFTFIVVQCDWRTAGFKEICLKAIWKTGVADAIAATGVICVVLATLMIWLSGLPS
jgi:hypothetical protein